MAKAKTKYPNGYITFCYEDNRFDAYRNYNEIPENSGKYLMGFFHSTYCGCVEVIDELYLAERPTISQVKAFMQRCKDIIASDR